METKRPTIERAGIEQLHEVRTPITVLVGVAVRLYRDGLAAALSAHEGLRILATAATGAEIKAAVASVQPDVTIVDITLDDVLTLIRTLRVEGACGHILAFAVGDDINMIIDYAKAGADGFFSANGSLEELVEAIERVAAGELLCSARMAAELLQQAARASPLNASSGMDQPLSQREEQVFTLLRQGRSNKQIATALHLSEATVKNHVHHLLQKMHASTRGEAVALAWSRGSRPPPFVTREAAPK